MFDSPPPSRDAARESKKYRVMSPQHVISGAHQRTASLLFCKQARDEAAKAVANLQTAPHVVQYQCLHARHSVFAALTHPVADMVVNHRTGASANADARRGYSCR